MSIPITSSILELDGSRLQNVNIASGVVGNPPSGDGVWGRDNALNIQNNDTLSTALDKIITFIEDSTVNNPSVNIFRANEITLNMYSNSPGNMPYTAISAMTGSSLTVINPSGNPKTNSFDVFYDNGGKMTPIIRYADNSIISYNNNLVNSQMNSTLDNPSIPLNNTGIKHFMTVSNDSNVEGVYNLNMFIGGSSLSVPSFNAGPSIFGFKLKHVNSSNKIFESNEVLFSIDNPITPSAAVSGTFGITNIIPSGYVSGIPVIKENDIITISFRADNCIRAFYNSNYIAKIYNNIKNDVFISPAPFTPVFPSVIPITGVPSTGGITNTNPIFNINVNFKENLYFDKNNLFNVTLDVRNSMNTTSTIIVNNVVVGVNTPFNKLICDSVSTGVKTTTFINENYIIIPVPEINRVPSGTNLYPLFTPSPNIMNINDFSDRAFNTIIDANTTKELILINGYYQYPPIGNQLFNFTNVSPIGPDYSNLLPDTSVISMPNLRWVTFAKRFASNINFTRLRFTIYTNPIGYPINWVSVDSQGNSPIVAGVQILATIREGLSDMPWFDCNKSGINPQNEGDPCLDAASSTLYEKYISCGRPNIPRNGTVFIRIGVPSGILISGISIA